MIDFLRKLLGLKPRKPRPRTVMIRTMPREIWESAWHEVYELAPAEDGTRRFYWPGPAAFRFTENASFIEEIRG